MCTVVEGTLAEGTSEDPIWTISPYLDAGQDLGKGCRARRWSGPGGPPLGTKGGWSSWPASLQGGRVLKPRMQGSFGILTKLETARTEVDQLPGSSLPPAALREEGK